MSDDKPKVVGLDGKAVTPAGNTDPVVIELLETMLEAARKGTYKAVGIVLVEDGGGMVTAYHTTGFCSPVEGFTYITHRINQSRNAE